MCSWQEVLHRLQRVRTVVILAGPLVQWALILEILPSPLPRGGGALLVLKKQLAAGLQFSVLAGFAQRRWGPRCLFRAF